MRRIVNQASQLVHYDIELFRIAKPPGAVCSWSILGAMACRGYTVHLADQTGQAERVVLEMISTHVVVFVFGTRSIHVFVHMVQFLLVRMIPGHALSCRCLVHAAYTSYVWYSWPSSELFLLRRHMHGAQAHGSVYS
jgi:hypothetical protein